MKLNLKCIKGIPVEDSERRTLNEIGFPVDAPGQPDLLRSLTWNNYCRKLSDTPYLPVGSVEKKYIKYLLVCRSREKALDCILSELQCYGIASSELIVGLTSGCVFTLSADEADALKNEFHYIIENLLPRQLSDIYYSFDIKPNPAHEVFFDLAAETLDIQKYTDQSKNNYGQFVTYPAGGICKRILSGESFQSIYQNTCATKKMIADAWYSIMSKESGTCSNYPLRKIELALFGLSRRYSYTLIHAGQEEYFAVKDDTGTVVLTVGYLSQAQFCRGYCYEKAIDCPSSCNPETHLIIDFDELTNGGHISSIIRDAIHDKRVIECHHRERDVHFTYGRTLADCEYNWEALQSAEICGCISCASIFSVSDITEWDVEESACCPRCGKSTVIAECQGYTITEEYLNEVRRYMEMLNDAYREDEDDE